MDKAKSSSQAGNPPTANEILVWRKQLLYVFSRVVLLFGALALIGPTIEAFMPPPEYWRVPMTMGFWVLAAVATFWPRVPYRLHAGAMVLLLYGIAVYNLMLTAQRGDGIPFLLIFVITAAIFLGARWGAAAIGLSLLTLVVFAWIYSNGLLVLPETRLLSYNTPGVWVNVTFVFLLLAAIPMLLQDYLVRRLVASLDKEHELTNELMQYQNTLEQRVIERTQELQIARDEAEAARKRAEQADRIKSQFLASMSHELRTPLNAVLNFTEMTAMGMLGSVNSQQEDVLTKSLDSGKHLLALINDVLDVSKMQSGMLTLFVEENVDLHAELQPVIDTARALLKDKPVQFITDIDENLPAIRGDKRRIRQILLNLVSNAVKFTEEGSVTLSAKKRDGEVLFAVLDTGPGIAADEQKIIFEPFQQTKTGIQHMGGTGLGLPISKHLAEAHGGRIWLESQPGDGAAFYVALPVAAAA